MPEKVRETFMVGRVQTDYHYILQYINERG